MKNLVAFFLGLGLFAVGLALAMLVGVVSVIVMLAARLTGRWQPAMGRTANHKPRTGHGSSHDFRVSNDGRGTIIDM